MNTDRIHEVLETFWAAQRRKTKGSIAAALIVGDLAIREKKAFPLDPSSFVTGDGNNGQVRGMGPRALATVLARHEVPIQATGEAGRTNRGTPGFMRDYVPLLNDLHFELRQTANFDSRAMIEVAQAFWAAKYRSKLEEKPFAFRVDAALGLRAAVAQLLNLARERSRTAGGSFAHGTVMQHLVGAKLSFVLGEEAEAAGLKHNNSNKKDEGLARDGDFNIGDCAIHVTVLPSKGVIAKCVANLGAGLQPLIITTPEGITRADALLDAEGIAGRVDILDIEQFITTNVYEWAGFRAKDRKPRLAALIERYNAITKQVEGNPSLTIDLK